MDQQKEKLETPVRAPAWARPGCEVILEFSATDLERIMAMLRGLDSAKPAARREDESA